MVKIEIPKNIPKTYHDRFEEDFRKCLEENKINHDEFKDRIKHSINAQKRHRELLNLCVYPFTETELKPGNYNFIRADPLEEIDQPNFDFLLFDFEGHAIFGEAKGNITEGMENKVIQDIKQQIEAVEQNIDYITSKYLLGEELKSIEYVIATFAPSGDQITKKIISNKEEIITWEIHQMKKDKGIKVNSAFPNPKNKPDDLEDEEIYNMIKHNDNKLNSELQKFSSSSECFDIFPKSTPLDKLRILINAKNKVNGMCLVNKQDVIESVKDDLFYLEEKRCQKVIKNIFRLGEKIDFLKEWEDDQNYNYKIVSRYTNSQGLEKTLEKKWIEYRIKQNEAEIEKRCKEKVKEKIQTLAEKQTTLSDF